MVFGSMNDDRRLSSVAILAKKRGVKLSWAEPARVLLCGRVDSGPIPSLDIASLTQLNLARHPEARSPLRSTLVLCTEHHLMLLLVF